MMTQQLRSKQIMLLLVLALCVPAASVSEPRQGILLLIGDVLSFKERVIWKRIFELAGGAGADIAVVAAANSRAKLYGEYAKRALLRYGPFVDLLPLAISPEEFDVDYRQAARDPDLIAQLRDANVVFFVGGEPQRLSQALLNEDGSATPLATAIRQVYASGGVVVGGIPGVAGAHTGIDVKRVLLRSRLPEQNMYTGLGLIADGWYVDQHFFSAGRFAETLVTMRQLAMSYGIGVGANTAAVIEGNALTVVGKGQVIIIDLSAATTATDGAGFNISGARLSYLEDGDRFDLATLGITPHPYKLEGFEIEPGAIGHRPLIENRKVTAELFDNNSLAEILLVALDSEPGQKTVLNFPVGVRAKGFQFRFYTGNDTKGWLTTRSGRERFTAHNIYLDITRRDVNQIVDLTE